METNADDASADLEYLGYYSPPDAAKLFDAFEAAGVDFAADVSDATGAIGPLVSSAGGTFGNAVRVLIRTDPARRADVDRIHQRLFGDCLPNYESSFFKEQRNLDPDDRASNDES